MLHMFPLTVLILLFQQQMIIQNGQFHPLVMAKVGSVWVI